MRVLKSILLAMGAAIVAGGALAQSDPKLVSTVDPDPIEVSQSRNVGSTNASLPEFIARASYVVTIKNGAANNLNRAAFTAKTYVVQALTNDVVAGASAPFDAAVPFIPVSGENPNCEIAVGDATSIVCNFGDSQLAPGDTAKFIIVVKAPAAGERIRLHWTFGGDEGKGGGNGCCTKVDDAYTGLVDPTAVGSTVKTHVQSFMVKNVLNKLFTGVSGGGATEADPWATVANLGAGYSVNGISQTYTKATVDEQVNLSSLGSCSALNNNQCWLSDISIPDTTWTGTNPLIIHLERHSSIIKKGSKLSNYILQYSKTPTVASSYKDLKLCSLGGDPPSLGAPSAGIPCIDVCVEIQLTSKPSPFIWRCTIKALDNGGYRSP